LRFFFFFQAEDGIRDKLVTGVQTCALPIYAVRLLVDITPADLIARLGEGKVYIREQAQRAVKHFFSPGNLTALRELALRRTAERSEERRVGKECRARWAVAP